MDAHRCQATTPSDLATVFVALGSEVELTRSGAKRRLPVAKLYTGPGEHCLAEGEVLTRVIVPPSASTRLGAFEKLQLWTGDFAVASVAVTADLDGGRWKNLRLCLGGIAPTPWEARLTAKHLEGKVASAAELRRELAEELWRESHPLPLNSWKVGVVARLGELAVTRLLATPPSI
jgi:CO/xanthine dehydrogenase FAD-binding subunit